jgi:hypothetical protein
MARVFVAILNSHLRRSPREISTYPFTVPSSFIGGVSRHGFLA